jgi:ribonuclease P protein component
LTGRKKIQELFSAGKAFNIGPFRVFWMPVPQAENCLQAGVGVSSRNFRKSVDRNKIKRLIRESYRQQKLPLAERMREMGNGLAIFILYTGREIPTFDLVFDKTSGIIAKLIQLTDEKSA